MRIVRPTTPDSGSKWFIRDMYLSISGKGLLSLLVNFPNDLHISDSLLYKISGSDKKLVEDTFKELEELKYVTYDDRTDTYVVYEKPLFID